MFLKRNRRTKGGETYEYWSLVETVRTERGPRHRLVANLGKLAGLDRNHRRGWENLANLLDGTDACAHQTTFDKIVGPQDETETKAEHTPCWAQVDVRGLRVERVRDFGEAYLALALWRRLHLHTALEKLLPAGRAAVPWSLVACILVVARFCGNKSELEVAERWYQDSALGRPPRGAAGYKINDARLYRGLDALARPQRRALPTPAWSATEGWFGVEFEFLLYDVTSTYFEGEAKKPTPRPSAATARDKRPDCKQVNIGLVVTPEGGLPIGL